MRGCGISVARPNSARWHVDFDRLFSDVLNDIPFVAQAPSGPPLNFYEFEDKFIVEAELPGVALEDLNINVKGNEVSLSGERKPRQLGQGEISHRREQWGGKFSRVFTLPAELDADRAEAQLRNGILSLTFPKAAKAMPRKIAVKQS